MSKTHYNGARLGFLLTEEETEKVAEVMDHLGLQPNDFLDHCINVMWGALKYGKR